MGQTQEMCAAMHKGTTKIYICHTTDTSLVFVMLQLYIGYEMAT